MSEKLQNIRETIDALDDELVVLLNKRASLALRIAEVKRGDGGGEALFYRPEREAEVLRRLLAVNSGPLSDDALLRIVREVMSSCLALEQTLKVAFLGPRGTFTESATFKHFGHGINALPHLSIGDVFRDVEAGVCEFGVVPVENSIEGAINQTLDRLITSNLLICGEVELRVHQHLLGRCQDLQQIRQIYSHEQSFSQCRNWLDGNLDHATRIAVRSNAEAAQHAQREDEAAAIAGDAAAEVYELPVLVRNIEDEPDNTTRFLVLGSNPAGATGNDKTSLLFSTANEPGSLHKALQCLADNNVSMTRIESRPSRQAMWEYVFFVDVQGHITDQPVEAAVAALRERTEMVKILGSYPCTVI